MKIILPPGRPGFTEMKEALDYARTQTRGLTATLYIGQLAGQKRVFTVASENWFHRFEQDAFLCCAVLPRAQTDA